jgi:hypothetical protein
MSLLDRLRPARGVHRPDSSAEERDALRESVDILVRHAVTHRLTAATARVDEALALVAGGKMSATDALLDVRCALQQVQR